MLEIRKTAIALEEEELLELEQIVADDDEKAALAFLRQRFYGKVARSQEARLNIFMMVVILSIVSRPVSSSHL